MPKVFDNSDNSDFTFTSRKSFLMTSQEQNILKQLAPFTHSATLAAVARGNEWSKAQAIASKPARAKRMGISRIVMCCVLGASAFSAQALTIDEVIKDMSSKSEAMVIDPRFSWQYEPAITMYAPRGDAIPSWWTGNRPEWTYDVLTWFTALEAEGNGATNTRVQIKDLRFYILSEKNRTWKQHDFKAAPGTDLWKYPFAYDSGNPGVRNESSGGISMKPKYPNFHHGYGNPITIDPRDVRAVFVAMEFRLVVDDPNRPDDRNSARYVVDAGGDYWPGNGQGTWSLGYAPGMGNGRMMLATKDWRTATMLIPNTRNGATMEEMRNNPPPLPGGSTATTTTAGATTTTQASTTTAAATTTTKAATTTTAGSATTTTVGGVTTTTQASGGSGSLTYSAPTAKHSGKCIDVAARSTADGARISQWTCHNGDNQQWAMRDAGNGQVQVISRNSGKCLDNTGSTRNGTAVTQSTCTTGARHLWKQQTESNGYSKLVSAASNKCLNVRSYSAADGAVIEQNLCANSDSQRFVLPTAAAQSAPKALVAKHSGKCLDVAGWSTVNGLQMQQWSCNGGTNQQWQLRDTGNSRYQVVSQTNGKCLEVANGSTADGAAVQQAECVAGASRQQWTLQAESGGYNKLKSAASNKCMDVNAISSADGAKIQQWNCNVANGDNQRWMIK
jgi:hypothetical protein